jgi:uncharacterized protein YbcV (DUF1398 family)
MNIKLMNEMAQAALTGTLNFGEIVMKLMAEGVESYRVDFVRKEKIFYMPSGETHIVKLPFKNHIIAVDFNAEGIQSAIKASQRGELKFIDFIPRALDAGVTSYMVFMSGKKVIYFGRKGDSHTELFPLAKP